MTLASIEGAPSAVLAGRLMTAAYAHLGLETHIVDLPSNRALMTAVAGEADADLMRISALDGRFESLVQVRYPLLRGQLRAITLDASITRWDAVELASRSVAIRRGVVIAEAAFAGMMVTRLEDPQQLIPMLERGRVDLIIVSDIVGISPNPGVDRSQYTIFDGAVATFTLHHYLHQDHAELAEPLAQTLKQMEASGESAAIIADYLRFLGQNGTWDTR